MKKGHKLFYILLLSILCILFIPKNVFAYNLTFQSQYTSDNQYLKFYIGAGASAKSKDIYNNSNVRNACLEGQWGYLYNDSSKKVGPNPWNFKTCKDIFDPEVNRPTTTNYISLKYSFFSINNYTSKYYYSTKPSNSTMVSYVRYAPNGKDAVIPYAQYINTKNGGSAATTYISTNGNPNLNFSKDIISAVELTTKYQILSNNVNLTEITMKNGDINKINTLLNGEIDKEAEQNNGIAKIRYAPILWTQFQGTHNDLDSAWKYYNLTQIGQSASNRWSPFTRGCSNYSLGTCSDSDSYADLSTLNEFDNIIQIPYSINKRKVFVRHIDINTNQLIPNAGNAYSVDGQKAGSNSDKYNPYNLPSQEYYSVSTGKGITLQKTSLTQINGYQLKYVGYKRGTSKSKDQALSLLNSSSTYNAQQVNVTASNDADYTYIDFYYDLKSNNNANVDLKGRLLFKSYDSDYQQSTNSESIDFIPVTKMISPYISDAYPYMLNDLKYSIVNNTLQIQYDTYHYDVIREDYYYNTVQVPTGEVDEKGKDITKTAYELDHKGYTYEKISMYDFPKETYYLDEGSEDKRIDYNIYPKRITTRHTIQIPIKYLAIRSINLWRISYSKLIDQANNKGGRLLDYNTDRNYDINTSSSYNSRTTPNIISPQYSINITNTQDIASSSNGYEHDTARTIEVNITNGYATIDGGRSIVIKTDLPYYAPNKSQYVNEATAETNPSENRGDQTFYTHSITRLNLVNAATDDVVQNYTENTKYFVEPGKMLEKGNFFDDESVTSSSELTSNSDFTSSYQIPYNMINGKRSPWATISYGKNTFNGYDNGGGLNSDFNSAAILYSNYGTVDNINTNKNLDNVGEDYTNSDPAKRSNNKVNIFTPIALLEPTIDSEKYVNHTDYSQKNIIEKDAYFTVTPQFTSSSEAGYASVDTHEFVKNSYITLSFDIKDAQLIRSGNFNNTIQNYVIAGSDNQRYSGDDIIVAGTPIKVPYGSALKAKSINYQGSSSVAQINNKIELKASTINDPDTLESYVAFENGDFFNNYRNTTVSGITGQSNYYQVSSNNYGASSIEDDAYYMAYISTQTTNLGRIYDFKVTDCTDVNWKEIFRTYNSDGNINGLTNKVYYSGINKWDISSGVDENYIVMRSDLGSNNATSKIAPRRILPLGPYKHDPVNYVNAPKLGYRFSYDLKTTGYMSFTDGSKREINISPSFYYISKDGTNYTSDITLYYKDTTDKYKQFIGNNYTIYFKPNDGYRYIYNANIESNYSTPNISRMSSKLVPLNIGNAKTNGAFTLNYDMMASSNDNFVQSWYGEYKLPNSTIAVKNGKDIENDKDAVLNNGYIGVVFNITCIDYDSTGKIVRKTSYNQKDTNKANSTNTTEWDYEGYLGFRTPGTTVSNSNPVSIQLEQGKWNISNDIYQKIKGTVVLYDTDSRAADDFD